ncbi:hypothetical protein Acel_0046 [Acidothermus cellulolyticus 11B]|uniref:DUF7712 domain-containing protein n=1 Tax=Acidothermus cellulolyticus (strain ATCC 43068 / DSM 8971 / 11B) TaxID=351607 RepID=A0LQW2_ACIC1|nr:hypothetical protein [Acidothermus cellulolyticus]ABK51822.1 hypothetical protein Acel_0046 [Acidothermus cellulolyticus 11B]
MNWRWSLRARDGGMTGLEFASAVTGGGHYRVLVHAAPAQLAVEVRHLDDDQLVARSDADRDGEYSPMTLLTIADGRVRRDEVWPTPEFYGLPVILAGGEVGVLRYWEHAADHSWWRWLIEFSNHKGWPPDWRPPELPPDALRPAIS